MDRLVAGRYGERCARLLGLIGRVGDTGQTGPDLLDQMEEEQTVTDTTDRPLRRRGVVQLHDEILEQVLRLPEGQRIIGFRCDPARLSIDVCLEGDGLPECAPGHEAPVVNAEPYITVLSRRWAIHGAELAERIEAWAVALERPEVRADVCVGGLVAGRLRDLLAGDFDPRSGQP